MKTENKNVWMIWAIAILAVMNITTLITVIYHRNKAEKNEVFTGTQMLQQGNTSMRFSWRYFQDQLSFSDEQMEKFMGINPEFRQKAAGINLRLAEKRQQMFSEMTRIKPDTKLLDRLSDSIGHLHSDLKKLTYKYYLDIGNICDQDQQEKLEQMFGWMFVTDAGMGRYGRGGPEGRRGGGRRFTN